MSLLSNIFSMGTKKITPLEETVPEVPVTQEFADVPYYISCLKNISQDFPLTSQINTLLDEVERLARVK